LFSIDLENWRVSIANFKENIESYIK